MRLMGRWRSDSRIGWRSSPPVLARLRGERDGFRRVLDIGRGGLRIVSPLPLRVGDSVLVRLRFPDLWEQVELVGQVAWRGTNGEVGLDCREEDEETKGLLNVLIEHQTVLARLQANPDE